MNTHIRIVRILWVLAGLALGALAIWGLISVREFESAVFSWILTLAFAVLACAAGITFGRSGAIGGVLIRVVSTLALLYSAAWLLLGGVEDAGSYGPGIVAAIVLSIYALFLARREAPAA